MLLCLLGVGLESICKCKRQKKFLNVECCYLNVDGLFKWIDGFRVSKLDDKIFCDSIAKHDIVCLAETQCGPENVIAIPGFKVYSKNRPKTFRSRHYFGGLMIAFRTVLATGVNVLETTTSEIS